ncbi:MAG: universal stress protein [Desulfobulbaceae bacterium]|uniref:Universal stress protein n=1 Tax=Candidatus Desulfobia pelagia TaxID=2841692 RepID=A0A8J6NF21_9BACT|nr:universal stress protein [Candidatus Desulfobia pelagia]
MKQIKKILVPVAFSPFTEGIVQYAIMFANSLSVERLIFMNVINQRDLDTVELISSFGYDVDKSHYIQEIKKQRSESLEKMLDRLDFPKDKMKFVMTIGNPSMKLLEYGVKQEVDIIIMGLRAKSDLIHVFTGSVAEKMFKSSPITIVSYREESLAAPLRKHIKLC